MTIRRWAEFTTALPYDGIEENGGFVQWPGRNVAEALEEILRGLGCTDIHVFNLEHAGYDVGFRWGKLPLGARVTVLDNPLIGFDNKHQPEYLELLERVSVALAADERFHDVRWFDDDEVLTGAEGAMSPLREPPNKPQPLDKTPAPRSATVRPWVQFATDLAEPQEEDGSPQRPIERVAKAISGMLARCGCRRVRWFFRGDRCCELKFFAGKRRLAARINLGDDHQVSIWQEGWTAKVFGLQRPEFVEVIRRFNIELARDPHFQDVRWFFESEIRSGSEGSASPIEDV